MGYATISVKTILNNIIEAAVVMLKVTVERKGDKIG
jgi:hypothetical protein